MRPFLALSGLFLLASSVACSPGSTAIVAAFAADAGVVQAVSHVTIEVRRGSQVRWATSVSLASLDLPGSLSLLDQQDGASSEPVRVSIAGFGAPPDGPSASPIIQRAASLRFVAGKSKLLRLGLARECLSVSCTPGDTCYRGACVSEIIEEPELLPDATEPSRDLDLGGFADLRQGSQGGASGASGGTGQSGASGRAGAGGAGLAGAGQAGSGMAGTAGQGGSSGVGGQGGSSGMGGDGGQAGVGGLAGAGGMAGDAGAAGSAGTGAAGAGGAGGEAGIAGQAGAAGDAGAAGQGGDGAAGAGQGGDAGAAGEAGAAGQGGDAGGQAGSGAGEAGASGVAGEGGAGQGGDAGQGGAGGDSAGQGGTGGTGATPEPALVPLAAGSTHTCAVMKGGLVKCWGDGFFGKLGSGSTATIGNNPAHMGDALLPVDLGAGFEARQVGAGNQFNCALSRDWKIKCWGYNGNGQLGVGDTSSRGDAVGEMGDALPFVDLGVDVRATSVCSGAIHACALLTDGRVKCWGGNSSGQLGLGDKVGHGDGVGPMGDALPFVDLGAGKKVVQLACGSVHNCALLEGGEVRCWGYNNNGQLGLGDKLNRGDDPGEMGDALPAVDLGTKAPASKLALGDSHSCALLIGGAVKCWGNNASGELGLGDTISRGGKPGDMGDALLTVDTGGAAQGIVSGTNGVCVSLASGQLRCWGVNNRGQLGQGDKVNRGDGPGEMGASLPPIDLGTGRSALRLAVGFESACALLDDSSVRCWGANYSGQLGLGDSQDRGDQPGEMGDALPAVSLGAPGL